MEPVRDEVAWFAEQMESSLQKHDSDIGPQGWLQDSPLVLFGRLLDEVAELHEVLLRGYNAGIIKECSDVGNFAMIIADLAGKEIE